MVKKRRKSKKKTFIIIGTVLIVAIIVAANVMHKTDEGLTVEADEVKRGEIIQTVSASGKIRPVVEVKISAKVSGTIVELTVDEGDSVHKGDLLLKLDRERYAAAVERSESGLKSAEASAWKADAEYERLKELYSAKLSFEAQLESAKAEHLLAESNVEQARAILREAKDDLSKTEIYSPMDGVVSQMNKELGEMVLGASFQEDVIMVVAELSRMEAEVEVDENDVVDVNLGDKASLEIDAFPDTTFKGKVSHIANTATTRGYGTQDEITNFLVKVAVLDKIKKIRPGMSTTVDIEVEKRDDALHIPIQCVAMRYPKKEEAPEGEKKDADANGETDSAESSAKDEKEKMIEVVFVIGEGDTARMVPVVTGISSDTDIEIIQGLEEGQKVVSGPYRILADKLKDGDLLKIEKKKEKKSEEEE